MSFPNNLNRNFPKYKELTKSDLIRANENNFIEFAEFWSKSPNLNLRILPNMARIESDITQLGGNFVSRSRIAEAVDITIEETKSYYISKGIEGFTWLIHPLDRPKNLGELLVEHGFKKGSSAPIMSMDLMKLGELSEIPGLEIKPVSTLEDMKTFYDIFRLTLKWFESIADDYFLIECDCGFNTSLPRRYFIGYMDGVPASISGILLGKEVAGVYNVGTLPEFRKLGLGTALTLTCLHEARSEGYNVGVLQSSRMGNSVYRKIGFNEDGVRTAYIYNV
jgi:ribosomal protein S18 acetylase RimI-like enzyme